MKTATFNGVRYDIDLEGMDASCEAPLKKTRLKGRPSICLVHGIKKDEYTLECLIHEALHACKWGATEKKVENTAKDISRFLWRLGYRLKNSNI